MIRRFVVLIITVVLIATTNMLYAQEETVTVPDVIGLSVPQAAAELNRAGLRLGSQTSFGWTADSGLPENAISEQQLAPGDTVPYGTAVDITVLRSNNALLVYDDNDITLVNQSGSAINLGSVAFTAIGGANSASFSAARWTGVLENGDCGQLWSVSRSGPKDVPECTESTFWLTTNDSAQHFWTGTNGNTLFSVLQNGIERAQCTVSATGTCSLYLDSTGTNLVTEYAYFAYTMDAYLFYNNSETQWMDLTQMTVATSEDGQLGPLGGIEQADNPERIVGTSNLLAPGQCVLVRANEDIQEPPVECDVIYTITITPSWQTFTFYFQGVNDTQRRSCPPAVPDRLTLCIIPN